MNAERPFVVLPFPQRRQGVVSTRETTRTTDGRIVAPVARQVVKRERSVRFFQDIRGLVHSGRPTTAQFVACATGRGIPADQTVR
jgi:hypothetical protein